VNSYRSGKALAGSSAQRSGGRPGVKPDDYVANAPKPTCPTISTLLRRRHLHGRPQSAELLFWIREAAKSKTRSSFPIRQRRQRTTNAAAAKKHPRVASASFHRPAWSKIPGPR
jgi:hypothetical protein